MRQLPLSLPHGSMASMDDTATGSRVLSGQIPAQAHTVGPSWTALPGPPVIAPATPPEWLQPAPTYEEAPARNP